MILFTYDGKRQAIVLWTGRKLSKSSPLSSYRPRSAGAYTVLRRAPVPAHWPRSNSWWVVRCNHCGSERRVLRTAIEQTRFGCADCWREARAERRPS